MVNEQEFKQAVTSCGFPCPSDIQYDSFRAGIPNSRITTKRELAMFLAQCLHESDGLRAKEEYAYAGNKCMDPYTGSTPGRQYYGRGYIQLSHDYNYRDASKALFNGDENVLLLNPDRVSNEEWLAWATAFWFWKDRVHTQEAVQQGRFGASTMAINSIECQPNADQELQTRAKARFAHYVKVLRAFGVHEQADESGCYS